MFNERKPSVHKLLAKVVPRPEFVGTLHDDDMARALGYPAALVPGIDLYAYLARLTLATWGEDWLRRGALSSSSLRPVYHGDPLVVYADAVRHEGGRRSVDLAVHNASGAMVATASAWIADEAPAPPGLDAFPLLERPAALPCGDPAALRVGMRFSSVAESVTAEANAQRVAEFLDDSPLYAAQGILHPAYLQRVALKNAHASFAHATPPIYITAEGRHFSPARVGDSIEVAGAITRLWERKGHHYMESEQLVIANRERAVMLVRRTTIYQARRDAQAGSPAGQKAAS
jgi:acyl dehydratase